MRTASLLLVSFAFETATAQPTRPPPPPDTTQDGAPVEPLGECTLFADIVPIISGRTASLRVVLKNTASTPAKVTLEGNCGARYTVRGQPRNTCPPSPCRPAPLKTYTVGAKRRLTLGTLTVKAKGDTCREPMPNGSTLFEAVATGKQMRVCSGPAVHVIKDAKTGALRKAKPNEPIVEPTPPSKMPPRAPKQCPACAIGCPGGRPSTAVDANGCRVCACEDLRPAAPTKTTPTTPLTSPTKPPPKAPKKPCPACGIGCPDGPPSSEVDENGCRVCACEDLRPTAPPKSP